MSGQGARSWALFNGACGAVTVMGWLGITPDRVGQLAYDVLYPTLPFLALLFGFLTGFFARKWHDSRELDALAERAAEDRRGIEAGAEALKSERDALKAEVEDLRRRYADERAYTAALLSRMPETQRLTREDVAAMVGESVSATLAEGVPSVKVGGFELRERENGNVSLAWTGNGK